MPSSWSPSLRFELQFTGENINLWGEKLNAALTRVDTAIAGWLVKPLTGSTSLSAGTSDTSSKVSATSESWGNLLGSEDCPSGIGQPHLVARASHRLAASFSSLTACWEGGADFPCPSS